MKERPTPIEIDGDCYVFNCSYMQALNYFTRFGDDAVVLSPEPLKKQFKEFYQKGLNCFDQK